MKNEFIEFVNALMEAAPEVVEEKMTDNIKNYLDTFIDKEDKSILTDNGKIILKYLQEHEPRMQKAKEIGEDTMLSSRSVSGSIRKLVSDGFVDRIGANPVVYMITSKGKEFIIED